MPSETPSPERHPASAQAGATACGWMPPSVGHLQEMLPQYEIISMIGRGGMGAVFKGRQKSLDRMVAIKILPPGLDDAGAEFTARFRNEARLMARLNHPGVVGVHDFGETAEGQFYFVMEYVDGTDVAKMISTSGRLPAEHALMITAHVCDALGYAHANGVIHRDIKPANIHINKLGQVKVTDFGLARQSDASMTAGLTKTGTTMGTPDFIAPEALTLGADVDGRADLYAVGVMLYQMLTGEIPRGLFLMPSVKTKGYIDPRFDRIITRAMQAEREERYQQASEIRKDLDVIQSSPRLKQDASKVVAAVPQAVVKSVPDQRTAAVEKQEAESGKQKSKSGLYLGIAAAVVIIGGGAALMFSGGKPAGDANSSGTDKASPENKRLVISSPTTSGPIKVVEPPKPPVAKSDPKPAPTGGTTNSEGWIDGLAEWLAVPGNVAKGTLKPYEAVWRWAGPEAVFLGGNPAVKSLANVAVRLTFRHGGRNSVAIKLRIEKTTGFNYNAVIRLDGTTEIKLWKDERDTLLAKFDPIPGFDPYASHVMEFRAQGDVLTLLVDGQTRGSVKDDTLGAGSFSISFGTIEKIEYRDLGSTAAVAEPAKGSDQAGSKSVPVGSLATSATSDGWIDGLAEWLAVPGNTSNGTLVKAGEGAWRYVGPSSIKLGDKDKLLANAAVRVTLQSLGDWVGIDLRDDSKTQRRYSMSLTAAGGIEILITADGKSMRLARFGVPAEFKAATRHVVEFRGEKELLTAVVDGQTMGAIKDANFPFAGRASVVAKNGVIERIEYRDLGGTAPTPPPPVPIGTWQDGLAPWWAKPETWRTGAMQQEAGGSRVLDDGPVWLAFNFRNIAVRATVLGGDAKSWRLGLRAKGGRSYAAILEANGGGRLVEITQPATSPAGSAAEKPLAAFDLPSGFTLASRHAVEFRAHGDLLTLRVDDKEVARVRDDSRQSGDVLFEGKGALIEKLEFSELGGDLR